MRTSLVPALAAGVALVWMGCQSLLTIKIEDTATTTVPAATLPEQLLNSFGFGAFTQMDLTQNQELQNQGVEPGDISSVYFDHLTLTATDPSGADLSFIDSLEFWVSAPNLDPVRIAWQDNFPAGQASVDLNLDDVDLTDYVVSESMTISAQVTGHSPDQATTVDADYAIKVSFTRQGCAKLTKKNSG